LRRKNDDHSAELLDDAYPKIRKRILDEDEIRRQDELDRLRAADVTITFEYQKELIDDAQGYLDVTFPQVPSYLIEYVQSILRRRGIKTLYVLPLNAVMPKKRHTAAAHAEFHQLLEPQKDS
jgi:hypothetical protein